MFYANQGFVLLLAEIAVSLLLYLAGGIPGIGLIAAIVSCLLYAAALVLAAMGIQCEQGQRAETAGHRKYRTTITI